MSFILDALDRSRREHDAQAEEPSLSPATDTTGADTAVIPWVPVLSLVLVIALAVITWLWLARAPATQPAAQPAVADVPTAQASTPVPPRATAASPRAPVADTARSAPTADVSRLYGEAHASQRSASTQSGPGDTEQGAAEPDGSRAGSGEHAVADMPPASESSEGVGEMPVEAMVARAEAAMDNIGLSAHPAPMLEELSQAVRDDIPTLIYSQHDYRASGGESSVLINREHRRAGDSTAGVRVREILPDSVVLSYRDTVFRLRALNSWVNL